VGPHSRVEVRVGRPLELNCEAEGNPLPRYQWLQRNPRSQQVSFLSAQLPVETLIILPSSLPAVQVFIRGYDRRLYIDNATYDHQGEFVCKALSKLGEEERSVQSEAIRVDVLGAPTVTPPSHAARVSMASGGGGLHEVHARVGEDAKLIVEYCADPAPSPVWELTGHGAMSGISLSAGINHGRFFAEVPSAVEGREDCYIAALRVAGAHQDDAGAYRLRLSNDHGARVHTIHLSVREHVSRESLIAVGVGAILTMLLLVLVCVYCCRAEGCCLSRCCSKREPSGGKKDFKPSDLER